MACYKYWSVRKNPNACQGVSHPPQKENPMTVNASLKVLITGTSGGFGHLTTLSLLAAGHTVVASMRDPGSRDAAAAVALLAAGAHVVELVGSPAGGRRF